MAFEFIDPSTVDWDAIQSEIEEQSPQVTEALDNGKSAVTEYISESIARSLNGVFLYILQILSDATGDIGAMIGFLANGFEEGKQRANIFNPIALMAQGDLQELFRRRIVDDDYYTDQLKRTGLDDTAVNNLKKVVRNLLNPPDIATAYYRGTVDADVAVEGLLDLGYTPEDAQTLIDNGSQLLDTERIVAAWLRGEIDDAEATERLRAIGYKPDAIELIKRLAMYIPPVEDLITMCVREVFSPEIAERFGQFEEFPREFAEYAQMKGVSRDWAERYWAAHWRLPSAEMGYEMLHRDVIDQGDLDLLLRAQDIMPYWRDKMVAISYRPYTRVDVRRMHKVGVLEKEDLVRAYKDIGYDDEKSEKMADFTEAYNLGAEKTLHKTELTRLYSEHIITREEYVKKLRGVGIAAKSAEYLAELADHKIEKKVLDEQIRSIGILYIEGRISAAQAQTRLTELGVLAAQALRHFDIWDAKKASKFKHLSVETLDKLLKQGLISQANYLNRVQILGYSAPDSRLLMELVLPKEA